MCIKQQKYNNKYFDDDDDDDDDNDNEAQINVMLRNQCRPLVWSHAGRDAIYPNS